MLGDLLLPFFENTSEETGPIIQSKNILLSKLFKAAKKYSFRYGMRDEAFDYLYKKQGPKIRQKLDVSLDEYLKAR